MNETMIELARRAVACVPLKGWPVGTVTDCGVIIHQSKEYGATVYDQGKEPIDQDALPDLNEPATLGCLDHLACQMHRCHQISTRVALTPQMSGLIDVWWKPVDLAGRSAGHGGKLLIHHCDENARVHALVAALEAARGGEDG